VPADSGLADSEAANSGPADSGFADSAPANSGNEETIILLEASQPDASGAATWMLCVWRVEAGSARGRALASALVVGSI